MKNDSARKGTVTTGQQTRTPGRATRDLLRFGLVVLMLLGYARIGGAQWTRVNQTNGPPSAVTCLLLTDGTVMCQENQTAHWWRLTPDKHGSYAGGTWSQLQDSPNNPNGYGPLYYASAVLPDGRVLVMGGEYDPNNGCNGCDENKGAIYDPVTNQWTTVAPPNGGNFPWNQVGDAPSVVLPDGTFLLGNLNSTQIARFNPSNLTWTVLGAGGKADNFSEEGLTLLANGTVLTVNTANQGDTGSEIYTPSTNSWASAGSTINSLVNNGGMPIVPETGPQVLRPNGTVVAFGATGFNSVYDSSTGLWTAAPSFPVINGNQFEVADGPASLMPNGNVLVAASPFFDAPSHIYDFDGTNLTQVADPPTNNVPAFVTRMLLLPTGEVLLTNSSNDLEVYATSTSVVGCSGCAPTITSSPANVTPGQTYSLSGTQLNGLSQASTYGDDAQMATNYPLVRITNTATGNVYYARTHDHSTMGVATGNATVSTSFDVPADAELGPSTLVVVANGIPSAPVNLGVTVATTLTFTSGSARSSDYHDAATVQAQLTVSSDHSAVSGQTITFKLGSGIGSETCTAVTDGSGNATCQITPQEAAGSYALTANFAGDAAHTGSSATTPFTITREQTTLGFAGGSPTVVANGQSATLSAVLKEDGTLAIQGRTVSITLGAQSCSAVTDATGTATCAIVISQVLGPGTANASFPGDGFYLPSSASESILVFAFPSRGAFVIGNRDGSTVTFWGAQWSQLNALSGGPPPNSFKGFASNTSDSCGSNWTSAPGNSSNPPSGPLPSYMGVIMSSSVGQSGPVISGDVPKIVVVTPNPGYGTSPGQSGTGNVVAVFCGHY